MYLGDQSIMKTWVNFTVAGKFSGELICRSSFLELTKQIEWLDGIKRSMFMWTIHLFK